MWSSNYKLQRGHFNFRLLPGQRVSSLLLCVCFVLIVNPDSDAKLASPRHSQSCSLGSIYCESGQEKLMNQLLSNYWRKNTSKLSYWTIVSYPFKIIYIIIYLCVFVVCWCVYTSVCAYVPMPCHGCGCLRTTCKSWFSFCHVGSCIKLRSSDLVQEPLPADSS